MFSQWEVISDQFSGIPRVFDVSSTLFVWLRKCRHVTAFVVEPVTDPNMRVFLEENVQALKYCYICAQLHMPHTGVKDLYVSAQTLPDVALVPNIERISLEINSVLDRKWLVSNVADKVTMCWVGDGALDSEVVCSLMSGIQCVKMCMLCRLVSFQKCHI